MVDYVPELGAVLRRLIALPRYTKRTFLVINDLALLTFAVWAAFSLRLNEFYVPPSRQVAWVEAAAPLIGIVTFHYSGLYSWLPAFSDRWECVAPSLRHS